MDWMSLNIAESLPPQPWTIQRFQWKYVIDVMFWIQRDWRYHFTPPSPWIPTFSCGPWLFTSDLSVPTPTWHFLKSNHHPHFIFSIKAMIMLYMPSCDPYSSPLQLLNLFLLLRCWVCMIQIWRVYNHQDFELKCVKLLDCHQDEFWASNFLIQMCAK